MILDPILAMLLQQAGMQVGGAILSKILPSDNSQYQQQVKSNLSYTNAIVPQLYQQAMGKPTQATQQAFSNLSNEVNRLQQSLAATAQRNVPQATSMGTSARVGQTRLQQAKVGAMGNIMAQQQQNAVNQLMGLGQQSMLQQSQIEAMERADRQATMTGLAGLLAKYQQGKQNAEFRAMFEPYMKALTDLLMGSMPTQTTSQPIVQQSTIKAQPASRANAISGVSQWKGGF